jgi:hypothetical protein
VLDLAVAPLTAWAAGERLHASREFALQASLAERLLKAAKQPATDADGEQEERAAAVALGWQVQGPLTAYHVRPNEDGAPAQTDPASAAVLITASLGQVPVLMRGGGWAGWSALPPQDVAERLRRCLPAMPWPAAAGVGTQVNGLAAAEESLLGAQAAAFVAGPGTVARADRMGPAELLGTLLETLAALLDEGGALRAAERLGVHRNTITTRLERIKAAGFDLDDPTTRLALQLACHVVRRSSGTSHATPA